MIRLHVPDPLGPGAEVVLAGGQSHYLAGVMRQGPGAEVALFNGRDGEWLGTVLEASRRGCRLGVSERLRAQAIGPDLDLIVALVKRPRLEAIAEKAAELGARRLRLALTERVNAAHVRLERLAAIATEAAEQTGRLDVPEVTAPRPLRALVNGAEPGRRLLFCDESGAAPPVLDALAGAPAGPWAILIGPEGGFTDAERALVRASPGCVAVSLGPRVLRADTAAIAALSLWQARIGDWSAVRSAGTV